MGRPGRTLLILAAMAIGGLVALMALADRYSDLLGQPSRAAATGEPDSVPVAPESPPAAVGAQRSPAEWLDAFLAVRQEMRRALDAAPAASAGQRLDLLREARGRALASSGLEEQEYRQVREVWRRAWRGEGAATEGFAEAFSERAERLSGPSLGAMEEFDP